MGSGRQEDTVVCKEGASGAAAHTERDVGRSSVSWGPRRGAAESDPSTYSPPRPALGNSTFLQSSSPCGTVLWGSPRITSSSRERTGFVGFPCASNSAQHTGSSKEIPPGWMEAHMRSCLSYHVDLPAFLLLLLPRLRPSSPPPRRLPARPLPPAGIQSRQLDPYANLCPARRSSGWGSRGLELSRSCLASASLPYLVPGHLTLQPHRGAPRTCPSFQVCSDSWPTC